MEKKEHLEKSEVKPVSRLKNLKWPSGERLAKAMREAEIEEISEARGHGPVQIVVGD